MSVSRCRPRRRLRSELLPLVVILSLPVALYLAFPSGALDRRGGGAVRRDEPMYCAFVRLDADREAQLLAAARASWQSDSSSRRGIRADLLNCGGSPERARIASGLLPSACVSAETVVEYECDFVPAGAAAEDPRALAPLDPSVPQPAFPKSDLLKLK